MQPRDYQIEIAEKATNILKQKKIVYLAMQVRTGKSLTSLLIAKNFNARNVLFLTKKKAIKSIEKDYLDFRFHFELKVINDESMHLVLDKDFDLVIHDEHHRFGTYPKQNKCAKLFKEKFGHLPMIFLSGTPHPESYSQVYHQFWVSNFSPFSTYKNFYNWAKDGFVNITQKHLRHGVVNDYSKGVQSLIERFTKSYMICYTQQQAGFKCEIVENFIEVEMKPITYQIIEKLKKDLFVSNKQNQIILADTPAKLIQKIHQLSSGTCKFEDGTSKVIDYSKIEAIYDKFKSHKIAIFYVYKEELKAIKDFLGNKVTDLLEDFDSQKEKWIALQLISGREGISLKNADYLIYYNIDFSALSYWQSRDRLTTIDREENNIFYVFSKNGIERKIYNTVLKKKNYTESVFKKDYDRTTIAI
jgi:hypothetical protein